MIMTPQTKKPFQIPWLGNLIRIRWGEIVIEGLIRMAGVSTIFIVGLIFLFLLREGLPAFLDIP
jgi:ABC-type phosphate transport system permease subunit